MLKFIHQVFSSCLKAPRASQPGRQPRWTMKMQQIAQKIGLKRLGNRTDCTKILPLLEKTKNVFLQYSRAIRAKDNVLNT